MILVKIMSAVVLPYNGPEHEESICLVLCWGV